MVTNLTQKFIYLTAMENYWKVSMKRRIAPVVIVYLFNINHHTV